MSANLSPDQIEKLKRANLANIVKKVREGKTLTASENRLLEAAAIDGATGELITTSRLATLFGVNRKSINQWRNEGRAGLPDKVDGKEPLEKWRAWFAANPDAGHSKNKPRKDRESLLCDKIEVEIALKNIELEKERGSLIERKQVDERDMAIAAAVKGALLKLANDTAPMLEGLEAAAIQKILREQVSGILQQLADDQSEFWRDE